MSKITVTLLRRAVWSAPTDASTAARRAGGRRWYNRHRKRLAHQRRRKVFQRILTLDVLPLPRGFRAQLARELGVSEATISRDVRQLGFC